MNQNSKPKRQSLETDLMPLTIGQSSKFNLSKIKQEIVGKDMAKEKYVKICLQCGSTDIKIPPAGMDIRMTKQDYCMDCSNMGVFPEIKESQIEKFRKRLNKKK